MRECYSKIEEFLNLDIIIGLLFSNGIIGRGLKDKISDTSSKLHQKRAVADHLLCLSETDLLKCCDILEQSDDKENLPKHREIAKDIRVILLADDNRAEKSYEDIQKMLSYFISNDEDKAVAFKVSVSYPVPKIGVKGVLHHPSFLQNYQKLWALCEEKPKLAFYCAESIKNGDHPLDIKIGLIQAGAGFFEESIPLLEWALKNCQKDECQNANLLSCRLNWHLMWCYDRMGDVEKREYHLENALQEAHVIEPDFSAAFILAWKSRQVMWQTDQSKDSEMKKVEDYLYTANNFIQHCNQMQWFAQGLKFYKADFHLGRSRHFRSIGNMAAADKHMDDCKRCLSDVGVAESQADIADRVNEDFQSKILSKIPGTQSEFAKYSCQLYYKFGQGERAQRVIAVVATEELCEAVNQANLIVPNENIHDSK